VATRFNLQPDRRFISLRDRLHERIQAAARTLNAQTFADVLDPLMQLSVRDAFDEAGAHEGTIWLADNNEEYLIPVYNTGSHTGQTLNTYRQPLSKGLISMVFKSGQAFCENSVYQNAEQDRTLDESLDVLTCSMIAVPFYFALEVRGVISCVQLKPASADAPDPQGFSPLDVHRIERSAAVLGRLIDFSLVGTTVAWQAS
jgi:hypothetical protein